jgi:nicotinamide riboside kinase
LKIIAISGAHRSTGKTTLARRLKEIIDQEIDDLKIKDPKIEDLKIDDLKTGDHKAAGPRIRLIKVGHGEEKDKDEILVHSLDELASIIRASSHSAHNECLLVESNRVHETVTPDLSIYIGSIDRPKKESADLARRRADIVIEEGLDSNQILTILNQKRLFNEAINNRIYKAIKDFYHDYLKRKGIKIMIEETHTSYELELTVNGKAVNTNPFVRDMISSTLLGMMRSLRGVDEPKEVIIKVIAR